MSRSGAAQYTREDLVNLQVPGHSSPFCRILKWLSKNYGIDQIRNS